MRGAPSCSGHLRILNTGDSRRLRITRRGSGGGKTHHSDRGMISATERYALRAGSLCEIIRRTPASRGAGHRVGEW